MEALDANSLTERLRWEQQDYWLHLEASSQLEKYPGMYHFLVLRGLERRVQTNDYHGQRNNMLDE
jgi:hypothetical protein